MKKEKVTYDTAKNTEKSFEKIQHPFRQPAIEINLHHLKKKKKKTSIQSLLNYSLQYANSDSSAQIVFPSFYL